MLTLGIETSCDDTSMALLEGKTRLLANVVSSQVVHASFGGVVPASHPRLAAIVVIDEPGGRLVYGGEVAAPVFANIMAGALRLLGVPPDGLDRVPATTLVQASRVP